MEVPLSTPEPFGSDLLLGARIGVGATGEVRRATVRSTGEQVAVKLLRPDLAGDPVLVARFLQEADALRRLDHPHLVRLRDVVLESGRLGLVVDLVEGGDLRRRLQEAGRLRPADAVETTAQVAEALTAVHAAGITHRDVKPANVLLDGEGRARLADLGIARLASAPELTRHSGVVGTPDYLAPEASMGQAGPASDVYALGVVLHELLAGQVPFTGPHPVAVLRQHLETPPPVLPVPAALAELLRRLLAKDPAARPTAAQAATALRGLLPQLAGAPALAAAPVAVAAGVATDTTHLRLPVAAPEPAPAAPVDDRRRRRVLAGVGVAAATALVAGAAAFTTLRDDDASPVDLAASERSPRPSASASRSASAPASAGPSSAASIDPGTGLPPGPGAVAGAAGGAAAPPAGAVAGGAGGGTSSGGSAATTSGGGAGGGAAPAPAAAAAPGPAAEPAPEAEPAPAPAQPAPAQPAPAQPAPAQPTQPRSLPSGASGCSGTARTSVGGATIETVSCIRYITSSTGKQLVQGDTYAREVPGSTHNSYGRLRVWVQLRRADGSFIAETICEVTGDFDQPTSDPYWAQCGRAADTAGAGVYSVGFVRGQDPFVQTDPGRLSQSPPL